MLPLQKERPWLNYTSQTAGGSQWWPSRGGTPRAAGRLARGAVGVHQHSLG